MKSKTFPAASVLIGLLTLLAARPCYADAIVEYKLVPTGGDDITGLLTGQLFWDQTTGTGEATFAFTPRPPGLPDLLLPPGEDLSFPARATGNGLAIDLGPAPAFVFWIGDDFLNPHTMRFFVTSNGEQGWDQYIFDTFRNDNRIVASGTGRWDPVVVPDAGCTFALLILSLVALGVAARWFRPQRMASS